MEISDQHFRDCGVEARLISKIGDGTGPTIVFVAGLHGNESTGVSTLKSSLNDLEALVAKKKSAFRGTVYGIAGNLTALGANKRFIDEDLNRMWSLKRVDQLQRMAVDDKNTEEREMSALLSCFEEILKHSSGPFFFIDLHSTSSRTAPHIIINDRLNNRKLSFKYPIPVILGIDSFVDGTLLSFFSEMGHLAIGFEGGHHDQPHTAANIEAFIWLTLGFTGVLSRKSIPNFKSLIERLHVTAQGHMQVYEVFHRYHVDSESSFKMVPGYNNFQPVVKGQYLANDGDHLVLAQNRGYIFLPRYEEQGNSGYYLLNKLSKGQLGASAFLQQIKFEKILAFLPGIERIEGIEDAYQVNKRVARFFVAGLFRLLGYRRFIRRGGKLLVAKRGLEDQE